jgi:hypothetical protein
VTWHAYLLRARLLAVEGRVILLAAATSAAHDDDDDEKRIQDELMWLMAQSIAAPCVESTEGAPSLA